MLIDIAAEFFASAGWPAERHPADQMLRATFEGENGPFTCFVVADEEKQQVVFYAVLPDLVPDEHLGAVAELTTRLNYELTIVAASLDYESGEVRFRAGVDVEGGELTAGMVKTMAANCCLNLDFHRVAIEAVAHGAISAADAYAALEP